MTKTELKKIQDELAAYDARCEMGIAHEPRYVTKMTTYRIAIAGA